MPLRLQAALFTLVVLGGGSSARDGPCVGSTHAMPAQDTW